MRYITTLGFFSKLGIFFLSLSVYANNDIFFSCKAGFEFESNRQAARCIKQQRFIYRSPLGCSSDRMEQVDTNKNSFKLVTDHQGNADLCVAIKDAPTNLNAMTSFSPFCPKEFKLQIKRGKDSCTKSTPETILAPTQPVKR